MRDADVIVVGAGPGGSVTAMLLARQGWDVLLLDRARFPREKVCGDGLTPRAVHTLQQLGLESHVAAHAFAVTHARLVAPSGVSFSLPFDPHVSPLPPRGYVLPRLRLDDLLRQEAVAAGSRFLAGARVRDVLQDGRRVVGVVVEREGTVSTYRARLVILAVGANIALLRRLGLVSQPPHEIVAVRGYWQGVENLQPALEFFFTRDLYPGYGWVFPTSEEEANIGIGVYRPNTTKALRSAAQVLRSFLRENDELRERLGRAAPRAQVRGYPIRTGFPSHSVAGAGWLVVGEAAGLVNPVTGEGIDLAMESAIIAAEVAHSALLGKVDARALWPYAWRLHRRFGHVFRGLRRLRPIVMRPRALDILIRKAAKHPPLAARIMGITLGTTSPYTAFLPSTWKWILS